MDEKPYIAFGLPSYDGKVVTDFASSYARTVYLLSSMGIPITEYRMDGCCYIDRARDDICHMFLTDPEKPTHLMFLDADMGWEPSDVVRLLKHDKEVVCGAYCQKVPEPKFPVILDDVPEVKDGLLRARGVPTGFMMISRQALERFQEAYPELIHNGIHHMAGKRVMAFFQMLIDGERYYREDLAFCMRYNQMGGETWIDPSIHLRHWNGTQCFEHNFMEMLRNRKKAA